MSIIHPTYDTYFVVGDNGVTHSDATVLPISEKSFAACKFAISGLDEVNYPKVLLKVTVKFSNILGNVIGMLGVYEISDSNWIGTDSYDKVDGKVSVSPIAISKPVSSLDWACEGDAKNPEIAFTIPASVVKQWKRNHLSLVSLAIANYGDFEQGGVVELDSAETALDIEESTQPAEEPFDVISTPSTLIPGGRASITITTPERTFGSDIEDIVVTLDGESVPVIAGDEHSVKVVVPDIPGKVEGMAELLITNGDGVALSNVTRVYYDASSTKRNKVFTAPARPDDDNERLSNSAVYNRDLGFNNFAEITDENSLVQNIYNILLTRKGERLFNSNFGTTIEERVFGIMNEDDETSILQECFAAIQEYEPRVSVDYEESRVDIDYDGNTIRVIIAVVLPSGSSEYIVLPFKTRGNIVK